MDPMPGTSTDAAGESRTTQTKLPGRSDSRRGGALASWNTASGAVRGRGAMAASAGHSRDRPLCDGPRTPRSSGSRRRGRDSSSRRTTALRCGGGVRHEAGPGALSPPACRGRSIVPPAARVDGAASETCELPRDGSGRRPAVAACAGRDSVALASSSAQAARRVGRRFICRASTPSRASCVPAKAPVATCQRCRSDRSVPRELAGLLPAWARLRPPNSGRAIGCRENRDGHRVGLLAERDGDLREAHE